jgi:hypothetical protein
MNSSSNPSPSGVPPSIRREPTDEELALAISEARKRYLLGCVFGILIALPAAAWAGFAVKTLWTWFVVPLGVTPVTVWQGIGLVVLAKLLTGDPSVQRDPNHNGLLAAVLIPAMALAVGGIYHILGGGL